MIIKQKIGSLNNFSVGERTIESVSIEWYETGKRIMHKRTSQGREIVIRFLNEAPNLTQGDVLYADELVVIAVNVPPCDAIVISPATMHEMASVCYEIGNKHLPLFYDNDEIAIPYDEPLYKLLTASGYQLKIETRKLLNQLKTTVTPHATSESRQTLFSKIMQLTSSSS